MPIRVARFAIDERSPHSDLYLSPLHCLCFNEALIPVKHLVNGTSVAQGAPSDMSAIEYYHIDLETHEVIYAEGALVESFFDGDSEREHFSNFVQYERLYGAEPRSKMTPFAPIHGYFSRREKIEGVASLSFPTLSMYAIRSKLLTTRLPDERKRCSSKNETAPATAPRRSVPRCHSRPQLSAEPF